jgi:hypothetical protein
MHLAESFTEAWNRHDVHALMALFQSEGTLTTPVFASPLSGAALRGYLEAQHNAYPDIKAEAAREKLFGTTTICGRFHVTGTWRHKVSCFSPVAGVRNYLRSTSKPWQSVVPVFSNECDAVSGRNETSPAFLDDSVNLPSA